MIKLHLNFARMASKIYVIVVKTHVAYWENHRKIFCSLYCMTKFWLSYISCGQNCYRHLLFAHVLLFFLSFLVCMCFTHRWKTIPAMLCNERNKSTEANSSRAPLLLLRVVSIHISWSWSMPFILLVCHFNERSHHLTLNLVPSLYLITEKRSCEKSNKDQDIFRYAFFCCCCCTKISTNYWAHEKWYLCIIWRLKWE